MRKIIVALAFATALMLAASCAFAERSDPFVLAHYTFDSADNLGADSSGNGNDLVGRVNPDGISAVSGVQGGAAYFGGSSGLIARDTANNDFIDLFDQAGGSKSLTLSFFAKVDMANARRGMNARVVDCGINGSDEGFTSLVNVNEAGGLYNISKTGGSDWWGGYGAVDGSAEDWHHYVMVYDAEQRKVVTYIDAQQRAEVAAGVDEKLLSAFTFCIGGSWAQWDWFNGGDNSVTCEGFTGAVDEVVVCAGAVYDLEFLRNLPVPEQVVYQMVARPAYDGMWDKNGSEPLLLTVAYFNNLGYFENIKESFINRIKLNNVYIDAEAIRVTRNADRTLTVAIDSDYLKEHCADGENTLFVFYEPDTYYHMTAVFTAY